MLIHQGSALGAGGKLLQSAHFKQSSFLSEETHRQRELRVQATFSCILCLFCVFSKDPSGESPGKRWDCIWSRGSPESLPPAISLTNQLSQDPQPFAASQCNCA